MGKITVPKGGCSLVTHGIGKCDLHNFACEIYYYVCLEAPCSQVHDMVMEGKREQGRIYINLYNLEIVSQRK